MSFKKFLAGAVVAAVAFAMVLPSAGAATLTMELLLALGLTPAQATAILAATSGSTTTSTYTYTTTLRPGMTGATAVQSCLSSKGFAVGTIDGKFGPMTSAAVKAFQMSKGLSADGIVGPNTGAALAAACVTTTTTSTTTTTTTTTPNNSNVALQDFIIEGGNEASVEDFDAKNGDDSDVMEGETGKEIARFEITWDDSDVLVERIDFMFDPATANTEDDPSKVFEDITLLINGDEIETVDGSDDDNWDDDMYDGDDTDTSLDDYSLRFTGINEIINEGEEAVVTLEVDVSDNIDGAPEEWEITIPNDGLRVTDTAGITGTAGNTSDTATVTIDAEGADNAFTVREGDDNPDDATVEVDDSNRTKITVLEFEIEADEDGEDLQINDLGIQADTSLVSGGVTETYATIVYETTLEIDGEEYDVDTVVATSGTTECDTSGAYTETALDPCLEWNFEKNEVVIEAGDTVIAKLIIEVNELDAAVSYGAGEIISADVDADDFDVEGDESKEAVTDLSGAVAGNDMTLQVDALSITMKGVTYNNTVNTNGLITSVDYYITLEVEAFGDTFYIPEGVSTSAGALVGFEYTLTNSPAANAATSTAILSSSTADVADDGNGDDFRRVNEGTPETFVLKVTAAAETGFTTSGGNTRVEMDNVFGVVTIADNDPSTTPGFTTFALTPAQDFRTDYRSIAYLP